MMQIASFLLCLAVAVSFCYGKYDPNKNFLKIILQFSWGRHCEAAFDCKLDVCLFNTHMEEIFSFSRSDRQIAELTSATQHAISRKIEWTMGNWVF